MKKKMFIFSEKKMKHWFYILYKTFITKIALRTLKETLTIQNVLQNF